MWIIWLVYALVIAGLFVLAYAYKTGARVNPKYIHAASILGLILSIASAALTRYLVPVDNNDEHYIQILNETSARHADFAKHYIEVAKSFKEPMWAFAKRANTTAVSEPQLAKTYLEASMALWRASNASLTAGKQHLDAAEALTLALHAWTEKRYGELDALTKTALTLSEATQALDKEYKEATLAAMEAAKRADAAAQADVNEPEASNVDSNGAGLELPKLEPA